MTDLFEEVEEQLRSDRYKQFAQRALPWMLGAAAAALIATLGYWGYDTWRTSQTDKASDQYVQAMEAFGQGDRDKARSLWTEVSKSGSSDCMYRSKRCGCRPARCHVFATRL